MCAHAHACISNDVKEMAVDLSSYEIQNACIHFFSPKYFLERKYA